MWIRTRLVPLVLFCCTALSLLGQQPKQKIENSEQLPVHSYRVPGKASNLLTDDAAFKAVSAALQRDLESDLRDYDIEDKTTLKKYYGSLMEIAVLDGQYDEALSYLQKRNVLEDKPAAKAMAGLLDQPLIDAKKAGAGQARATVEAEFKQRLNAIPYEVVQNEVKGMKRCRFFYYHERITWHGTLGHACRRASGISERGGAFLPSVTDQHCGGPAPYRLSKL
jgi:hypothetical protein